MQIYPLIDYEFEATLEVLCIRLQAVEIVVNDRLWAAVRLAYELRQNAGGSAGPALLPPPGRVQQLSV